MKSKILVSCSFILSVFISSCDKETIRASDEITVRNVDFSTFSNLRVSDALNIYITFSDTEEKIEVEANKNLQDKILVRNIGNDLVIDMQDGLNIKGNPRIKIFITTNNIASYNINGASSITLENNAVTEKIEVELSGASNFSGELEIARLDARADGASDIDIFGTIAELEADLGGSSTMTDYDAVVSKLNLKLSGASNASLFVSESISIEASGASTLRYKGDAIVEDQNLTGASELLKVD